MNNEENVSTRETSAEAVQSETAGKKSKKKLVPIIAVIAAVCLAAAAGIAFAVLSRKDGPKITVWGNVVSDEPVAVALADGEGEYLTTVEENAVIVPLNIENKDRLTLRTDFGTVNVYRPGTGTVLSSGRFCAINGSGYVEWVINSPDKLAQYKIKINDDAELTLKYDSSLKGWAVVRDK